MPGKTGLERTIFAAIFTAMKYRACEQPTILVRFHYNSSAILTAICEKQAHSSAAAYTAHAKICCNFENKIRLFLLLSLYTVCQTFCHEQVQNFFGGTPFFIRYGLFLSLG